MALNRAQHRYLLVAITFSALVYQDPTKHAIRALTPKIEKEDPHYQLAANWQVSPANRNALQRKSFGSE